MGEITHFEDEIRNKTLVKNIPNTEFTEEAFRLGDYFDPEAFRESYSNTVEDIEFHVDFAFEPWEAYCAGPDEVDVERSFSDMYWLDIRVDLTEMDPDRQRLIARLIADAWDQRRRR